MLHLLQSPALTNAVVERIASGDDVLLHACTVWAVLEGHADNGMLSKLLDQQCRVYVLQEALTVNGIEINRVLTGIEIIDYAGFVALTVKNPVISTWC